MISYWTHATKRLLAEEDGPTAVEYAVMLALIVGTCIIAIQTMASATGDSFNSSSNAIEGALSP